MINRIERKKRVERMENGILLTITMLVSNRRETIEKCMESLKPLLDHVSSELIVVDTAGDTECMDVVKRYTSHIVRFQWCNDFAAARNAGLKKAKGQWVMFLDDDEWFEDTIEIEEFFLNGTYQDYNGAAYITRNYENFQGTKWGDRVARRICRIGKDTCFVGKIHEYLNPMQGPIYYMKAYVHHYGYVYQTEQEKLAHSWRNIKLLLESRKEKQEDSQVLAQLLQEYLIVGERFSALEVARELCMHKDRYKPERLGFTAYAEVKVVELYRDQSLYKEAYEIGKKIVEEERALHVSRGCVANLLVGICQQIEKYPEAVFYIDQFQYYLKIWEENQEKLKLTDFFGVAERYLTQKEKSRLNLVKMHVYAKQQLWEEGKKVLNEIIWKKQTAFLTDTPEDIIQIICHTEYANGYAEGIETIFHLPELKNSVNREIHKLGEEEKERVWFCFTKINSNDKQIMEYQLCYYFRKEDKDAIENIFIKWKELNYTFFLLESYYWKGLRKLQISLTEWIDTVRTEEWIQSVEILFNRLEKEDCENVYCVLIQDLQKKDIRFLHLTGLWMEKQLLAEREWKVERLEIKGNDFDEVWDKLYKIASLWISCAAMLYREIVFQEELQSALPARYQFSWLIYQANAAKTYSKKFIKKVADAAKVYLKMGEICKCVLKYYELL